MKEYKTYPVEITLGGQTKTYSPAFQQEEQFAEGWKKVLVMSHGKALLRCLCGGAGEKRLSIHSISAIDKFHLARFPDSGPEHADDCIFWGADPNASGMSAYRRGVVEELDDGNTKIKLKIGLQQRSTKAPDEAEQAGAKPVQTNRKPGQTSMSLLGLLHYLWTQAGLNTWSPGMQGKRTMGVVHYHLQRIATSTYAGRIKLSQNLLIGAPAEGKQALMNQAKSQAASAERRRLVVIAPLAKHHDESELASTLPISTYHGIPHLLMNGELWETLQKRFSREINAWRSGNPSIAIVQTDPPKSSGGNMTAQVVDISLMSVSQDWIPVESSFEVLVAEKLVAEGRRFEKPLRFDADDVTFPDFWLKDVGAPIPMEVWGMTSTDYQTRKAEKSTYYDETYGKDGWWGWNGAAGDDLPDFPARLDQVDLDQAVS
ncbi:DUF1173 family protein [Bordetella sp. FB-8]|uniref:DUF1173 family protein n=1 Tax=Bordetella sp. FB-8 TaxID=1159870 RepID=UPI00036EF933|nr:DUF1173 family protein [Bordetella sp. FB-8]